MGLIEKLASSEAGGSWHINTCNKADTFTQAVHCIVAYLVRSSRAVFTEPFFSIFDSELVSLCIWNRMLACQKPAFSLKCPTAFPYSVCLFVTAELFDPLTDIIYDSNGKCELFPLHITQLWFPVSHRRNVELALKGTMLLDRQTFYCFREKKQQKTRFKMVDFQSKLCIPCC